MKKGKETIVDIVYISCTDNICVFFLGTKT